MTPTEAELDLWSTVAELRNETGQFPMDLTAPAEVIEAEAWFAGTGLARWRGPFPGREVSVSAPSCGRPSH